MTDTLQVSTRKGLFTVENAGGRWDVAKVDFLGDNVTLTLTDPRSGRSFRRPRSRPFRRQAASLDRERLGGDRRARLSAQARRVRGERHLGPSSGVEHGAHLGTRRGRRRPTGRHLVRHAARRAVPFAR